MSKHVCPWWIGYLLASPIRRLVQSPDRILAPYVRAGMTVLEPGPGMGFFTFPLARMVGYAGSVIVVDIQPKMLAVLARRAGKAGLLARLQIRTAQKDTLGLSDLAERVDFVLAFAMVHELPSARSFFQEVAGAVKPGACLLLAEPSGHVPVPLFEAELAAAAAAGLTVVEQPVIWRSRTALLRKG